MPRKRSKPTAENVEPVDAEQLPEQPSAPPPVDERPESTHAEKVLDRRPHGITKGDTPRDKLEPNPFPQYFVNLGDAPGAPFMRMYRERPNRELGFREHAAVIMFSEPPPAAIRQQLSTAGWGYQARERVWRKALGPNINVEDFEAQRLFEGIANELRAANGFGPVTGLKNGLS